MPHAFDGGQRMHAGVESVALGVREIGFEPEINRVNEHCWYSVKGGIYGEKRTRLLCGLGTTSSSFSAFSNFSPHRSSIALSASFN
jgi:hypothetical protein